MHKQFKGFTGYSDDEKKEIWTNSLVIIDTNILNNLYRYKDSRASEQLINILNMLKKEERLWIPYHVAFEYFFNLKQNKQISEDSYSNLKKELTRFNADYKKNIKKYKDEYYYINFSDLEKFENNLDEISNEIKSIIDIKVKEMPDSDEIALNIEKVLDGITGNPFNPDELKAIESEGKKRYDDKIPPGYEDVGKTSTTRRVYGTYEYHPVYGDLIIWKEILKKAQKEKRPTVFVTEDAKEDWWLIKNNKKIGAQPHLVKEYYDASEKEIIFSSMKNFLKNIGEYLGSDYVVENLQDISLETEGLKKIFSDEEIEELNIYDLDIGLIDKNLSDFYEVFPDGKIDKEGKFKTYIKGKIRSAEKINREEVQPYARHQMIRRTYQVDKKVYSEGVARMICQYLTIRYSPFVYAEYHENKVYALCNMGYEDTVEDFLQFFSIE